MAKVVLLEDDSDVSYKWAKLTEMGNITELQMMTHKNNGCVIRKIDKDMYCDVRTGEVKEYNHYDDRSDSVNNIRQTMNKLRGYINTNVVVPKNCKWVTFTYAENMTDAKRLYLDFKSFWKRFKYQSHKRGFAIPEYISVVEPQSRGAWHIHAFFIYQEKCPFIPKNIDVIKRLCLDDNFNLSACWGHGFVDIQNVKNVDNIGAYFTAYLTDIPLDEMVLEPFKSYEVLEKTFEDAEGLTKTKKFVKGARLSMYPSGMNLFRCSKGIKKPVVTVTTVDKAKEKVSDATETFSRIFNIVDCDGKSINTISKKYYNGIVTQKNKVVKL